MTARDRTGGLLVVLSFALNIVTAVYVPLVVTLIGTRLIQSVRPIDYFQWAVFAYVGLNIASALIRPSGQKHKSLDNWGSWIAATSICLTAILVFVPQARDYMKEFFTQEGFVTPVWPHELNNWLIGLAGFALFDVLILQHPGRREKLGLDREGPSALYVAQSSAMPIVRPEDTQQYPNLTIGSVSVSDIHGSFDERHTFEELSTMCGVVGPLSLDGCKLVVKVEGGVHIAQPVGYRLAVATGPDADGVTPDQQFSFLSGRAIEQLRAFAAAGGVVPLDRCFFVNISSGPRIAAPVGWHVSMYRPALPPRA